MDNGHWRKVLYCMITGANVYVCNRVANAVKTVLNTLLSVELWIRRYNEETKFSVTPSFVLAHSSDSI